MTGALRFLCGHGASAPDAVALGRSCPLCKLIASSGRTRTELEARVARGQRERFRSEVSPAAEYDWNCRRGHDRYRASVLEALGGDACPKCRSGVTAFANQREAGVPSMKANLRVGTSMAEQRLRALLEEHIVIPRGVNRVRIAGSFHGRNEVWPDIVIPALKVAIEYDSPGRGGDWHRGLREASDREKDALLADVGWEVIRVRTGSLEPLGKWSLSANGPTAKLADEIVAMLERIRGVAAVDAIRRPLSRDDAPTATPTPGPSKER
ncbi:MAG TPA: hypothetical protein VK139_04805 [Microbacteriaceae bacterium]|nr:hypothetical protein [Microbacteriaceae bacterium]